MTLLAPRNGSSLSTFISRLSNGRMRPQINLILHAKGRKEHKSSARATTEWIHPVLVDVWSLILYCHVNAFPIPKIVWRTNPLVSGV